MSRAAEISILRRNEIIFANLAAAKARMCPGIVWAANVRFRAKEWATTQETPRYFTATAARSREEPQPKFRPATSTSPRPMVEASSGLSRSRQWLAIFSGSFSRT